MKPGQTYDEALKDMNHAMDKLHDTVGTYTKNLDKLLDVVMPSKKITRMFLLFPRKINGQWLWLVWVDRVKIKHFTGAKETKWVTEGDKFVEEL